MIAAVETEGTNGKLSEQHQRSHRGVSGAQQQVRRYHTTASNILLPEKRESSEVVRCLFSDEHHSSFETSSPITGLKYIKRKTCGAVVDINYANIHELQVIGLSKTQADSVVNYRVQHGHFQLKKDLKKVPGIDDESWNRIKSKFTLVPSENTTVDHTSNSTRSPTIDRTEELGSEIGRAREVVDINSSNCHELCVIGLNKSEAQALVNYRVGHGKFESKEAVKQVPGITDETYERVQARMTFKHAFLNSDQRKKKQLLSQNSSKKKLLSSNSSSIHQLWTSPTKILPVENIPSFQHNLERSPHSESSVVSLMPRCKFSTVHTDPEVQRAATDRGLTAQSDLRFQKSPLKMNPPCSPDFQGSFNVMKPKRSIIRIATWNLQCLNEEKLANSAVLEVVCSVISKHGY